MNHHLLRIFSKLTCGATLLLIFAGGLVTSTGSGLSVPDWPLSYGTLFPPMVGGIVYEHSHRVMASIVGLMMLILCVWLWRVEKRKWVKLLAAVALGAVILQGLLGGLTVLWMLPTVVSVSHGVLAQTFFLLTIWIAYSQCKERQLRIDNISLEKYSSSAFRWAGILMGLIYVQLMIAAIMRHTHSGLAVPDFPTMGGSFFPRLDENMLIWINNWRFMQGLEEDPVNIWQVQIHLLHRLMALVIFIWVHCVLFKIKKDTQVSLVSKKTLTLIVLIIFFQVALGIATILTQKAPTVTTLHVAVGALSLGLSFLLCLRLFPVQLEKI